MYVFSLDQLFSQVPWEGGDGLSLSNTYCAKKQAFSSSLLLLALSSSFSYQFPLWFFPLAHSSASQNSIWGFSESQCTVIPLMANVEYNIDNISILPSKIGVSGASVAHLLSPPLISAELQWTVLCQLRFTLQWPTLNVLYTSSCLPQVLIWHWGSAPGTKTSAAQKLRRFNDPRGNLQMREDGS